MTTEVAKAEADAAILRERADEERVAHHYRQGVADTSWSHQRKGNEFAERYARDAHECWLVAKACEFYAVHLLEEADRLANAPTPTPSTPTAPGGE